MTAPNFSSVDEYKQLADHVDFVLKNDTVTLELFGNKKSADVTRTNEGLITDMLRSALKESTTRQWVIFKATITTGDGEVLFSGLFNYSCFRNFAILFWHSASHANVTYREALTFQYTFVEDQDSASYTSPFRWE